MAGSRGKMGRNDKGGYDGSGIITPRPLPVVRPKMDMHALAKTIAQPKRPGMGSVSLRQGVVTDVSLSANTCTITLSGDTTEIPGVAYMSPPPIGGSVWVATDGQDLFVLGSLDTWEPSTPSGRRNFIRNGDMRIQHRGVGAVSSGYGLDGWYTAPSIATMSTTGQAFTLGEFQGHSSHYLQTVVTGSASAGAHAIIQAQVQEIRELASCDVMLSFWAKASTTASVGIELTQTFGSGGGASSEVPGTGVPVALTTSWVRYSVPWTLPSIAGKTIGTDGKECVRVNFWLNAGSTYATRAGSIGSQTFTFSLWGVQLERGNRVTPFELIPYAEQAHWNRAYYQTGVARFDGYAYNGIGFTVPQMFTPSMRYTPTVTQTNISNTNFGAGTGQLDVTYYGFYSYRVGTATGGAAWRESWVASAELA